MICSNYKCIRLIIRYVYHNMINKDSSIYFVQLRCRVCTEVYVHIELPLQQMANCVVIIES